MADQPLDAATDSPSLWASRSFVVAALFLGSLALAAIVLVVRGGDSPAASANPPATTSTSTVTAVDPDASVCGLPAGDQQIPAIAPTTEWEQFGTFQAPKVAGVGPGITNPSTSRSCFAHSPTGALLAAANYLAITGRYRDWQVIQPLLEGPTEVLNKLSQNERGTAEPGRIVGYRIVSYAPAAATVEVAVEVTTPPPGGTVSISLPMVWRRGDWRVYVPDTSPPLVAVLTNLSGFIPWRASP